MRGLTVAEHEVLTQMATDTPDHWFETGDIVEVRLLSLHGAGRASLTFEYDVRRYSVTELGRLALKIWPLNKEA